MQGNKGFGMEKQNHAPRKQHQHPPHPPPAGPANGQQANSQSECGARPAALLRLGALLGPSRTRVVALLLGGQEEGLPSEGSRGCG